MYTQMFVFTQGKLLRQLPTRQHRAFHFVPATFRHCITSKAITRLNDKTGSATNVYNCRVSELVIRFRALFLPANHVPTSHATKQRHLFQQSTTMVYSYFYISIHYCGRSYNVAFRSDEGFRCTTF